MRITSQVSPGTETTYHPQILGLTVKDPAKAKDDDWVTLRTHIDLTSPEEAIAYLNEFIVTGSEQTFRIAKQTVTVEIVEIPDGALSFTS